MSTILKALRRLEEDRAHAAERPLREEIVAAAGIPRRSKALRWAGVGILAAGAAGVALALWPGSPAPPDGTSDSAASRSQPISQPLAGPAVRTPSAPAGEARGPSRAAREMPPPPRVPAPQNPSPPPATAEAARSRGHGAVARAEKASRTAPPAPRVPPPAPPKAPSVEQVAPNPLPEIVVARTVWHPDPGKRVALIRIEGRAEALRLREGDAVGSLVVRQIEPAGVLFERGGVEMLRPVGGK